ncbi:MAG: lytic transglycosylase domain-containing protein [Bauldia sp.]
MEKVKLAVCSMVVAACVGNAWAAAPEIPVPRPKPVMVKTAAVAPSTVAAKPAPASVKPAPAAVKIDGRFAIWLDAMRSDATSANIAEAITALGDWPGLSALYARYEQALRREAPKPDVVVAAFASRAPVSIDGNLLLAKALRAVGRSADAAAMIRTLWRQKDLSEPVEKTVLADFGDALRPEDHWARVDRLLYAGQTAAALRTAKRLDKPLLAAAEARAAVIRGARTAAKLLDSVPEPARADPGYRLARAQFMRRNGRIADAATELIASPADIGPQGDADVWSEERRDLARRLLESGDPATAYKVLAAAKARSQTPRVEAEFEAGWYALRFLQSPAVARGHFQAILDNSNTPVSQARGHYWLGRVAEVEGDDLEAKASFSRAAMFPTTFYGQVATLRLRQTDLKLVQPPQPDAATATAFTERDMVRSIVQLQQAGRGEEAQPLYRHLAQTLTDPGEIALLARLAEEAGDFTMVVNIGKQAQQRGIGVGTLAFPVAALPPYAGPAKVETAVLYAIARQESTFNQRVVSSAGAVGILQVMPQYAREMAERAGIPYVKDRVRTDRDYNIQIGAAELAGLVADYNGSYLLAFAGYNAGRGRVAQWIKAYGDPRSPDVDPLDWIERIPFSETRNYVQRALENLQVYRVQLDAPTLRLAADLVGNRKEAVAER